MDFRREKLSRRDFLASLAAAASMVGCAPTLQLGSHNSNQDLPVPDQSGIDHIVLVMMENRSFDHLLGWLPGANGKQAGLSFPDRNGLLQPTHHLTDFQGCGFQDPNHSYSGGHAEYDNGNCDGWLQVNDTYSIGYYEQNDLAFMGSAAPGWTVCDNYFAAILSETTPNRLYQHAAQTDRLADTADLTTLPTIWDLLQNAGVTGKYYYNNFRVLSFWGTKYLGISHPYSEFLADCAARNLAQVSFIDPVFGDGSGEFTTDDHPHGDIRNGEAFLNQIYQAVTCSPHWPHILLIINFDEWGGFYDHVPPPTAPIPHADQLAGNLDGRLGFRTPALLIGPRARRNHISHLQFDHTSVLKLIEWRWGLPSLTVRDAAANNLALALDFQHPNLFAPVYTVPTGPFGAPCKQS